MAFSVLCFSKLCHSICCHIHTGISKGYITNIELCSIFWSFQFPFYTLSACPSKRSLHDPALQYPPQTRKKKYTRFSWAAGKLPTQAGVFSPNGSRLLCFKVRWSLVYGCGSDHGACSPPGSVWSPFSSACFPHSVFLAFSLFTYAAQLLLICWLQPGVFASVAFRGSG